MAQRYAVSASTPPQGPYERDGRSPAPDVGYRHPETHTHTHTRSLDRAQATHSSPPVSETPPSQGSILEEEEERPFKVRFSERVDRLRQAIFKAFRLDDLSDETEILGVLMYAFEYLQECNSAGLRAELEAKLIERLFQCLRVVSYSGAAFETVCRILTFLVTTEELQVSECHAVCQAVCEQFLCCFEEVVSGAARKSFLARKGEGLEGTRKERQFQNYSNSLLFVLSFCLAESSDLFQTFVAMNGPSNLVQLLVSMISRKDIGGPAQNTPRNPEAPLSSGRNVGILSDRSSNNPMTARMRPQNSLQRFPYLKHYYSCSSCSFPTSEEKGGDDDGMRKVILPKPNSARSKEESVRGDASMSSMGFSALPHVPTGSRSAHSTTLSITSSHLSPRKTEDALQRGKQPPPVPQFNKVQPPTLPGGSAGLAHFFRRESAGSITLVDTPEEDGQPLNRGGSANSFDDMGFPEGEMERKLSTPAITKPDIVPILSLQAVNSDDKVATAQSRDTRRRHQHSPSVVAGTGTPHSTFDRSGSLPNRQMSSNSALKINGATLAPDSPYSGDDSGGTSDRSSFTELSKGEAIHKRELQLIAGKLGQLFVIGDLTGLMALKGHPQVSVGENVSSSAMQSAVEHHRVLTEANPAMEASSTMVSGDVSVDINGVPFLDRSPRAAMNADEVQFLSLRQRSDFASPEILSNYLILSCLAQLTLYPVVRDQMSRLPINALIQWLFHKDAELEAIASLSLPKRRPGHRHQPSIAVDPTRGESLTGDESSDFTFHDYFSRKLRPEYNYNWNHPVRIAIASSRDIQPHKLQLFLVSRARQSAQRVLLHFTVPSPRNDISLLNFDSDSVLQHIRGGSGLSSFEGSAYVESFDSEAVSPEAAHRLNKVALHNAAVPPWSSEEVPVPSSNPFIWRVCGALSAMVTFLECEDMDNSETWLEVQRLLEILSGYLQTALSNSRSLCAQIVNQALSIALRLLNRFTQVNKLRWEHVLALHSVLEIIGAMCSYSVLASHPVVLEFVVLSLIGRRNSFGGFAFPSTGAPSPVPSASGRGGGENPHNLGAAPNTHSRKYSDDSMGSHMFSDRTVDTSTSSSDAFEWMSLYMTATVQVAGSFIAVGDEIDRLATPRSSVSFLQHDAGREEDIELERTVIQLRKVWASRVWQSNTRTSFSLQDHVTRCLGFYRVLVSLVSSYHNVCYMDLTFLSESQRAQRTREVTQMMRRFEFLLHPQRGALLFLLSREGILSKHSRVEDLEGLELVVEKAWISMQYECLHLVGDFFRTPVCPFLSDNVYVSHYVSLHYLQMVLFLSTVRPEFSRKKSSASDDTLDLASIGLHMARLHAEVLLSFASHTIGVNHQTNRKAVALVRKQLQELRVALYLTRLLELETQYTEQLFRTGNPVVRAQSTFSELSDQLELMQGGVDEDGEDEPVDFLFARSESVGEKEMESLSVVCMTSRNGEEEEEDFKPIWDRSPERSPEEAVTDQGDDGTVEDDQGSYHSGDMEFDLSDCESDDDGGDSKEVETEMSFNLSVASGDSPAADPGLGKQSLPPMLSQKSLLLELDESLIKGGKAGARSGNESRGVNPSSSMAPPLASAKGGRSDKVSAPRIPQLIAGGRGLPVRSGDDGIRGTPRSARVVEDADGLVVISGANPGAILSKESSRADTLRVAHVFHGGDSSFDEAASSSEDAMSTSVGEFFSSHESFSFDDPLCGVDEAASGSSHVNDSVPVSRQLKGKKHRHRKREISHGEKAPQRLPLQDASLHAGTNGTQHPVTAQSGDTRSKSCTNCEEKNLRCQFVTEGRKEGQVCCKWCQARKLADSCRVPADEAPPVSPPKQSTTTSAPACCANCSAKGLRCSLVLKSGTAPPCNWCKALKIDCCPACPEGVVVTDTPLLRVSDKTDLPPLKSELGVACKNCIEKGLRCNFVAAGVTSPEEVCKWCRALKVDKCVHVSEEDLDRALAASQNSASNAASSTVQSKPSHGGTRASKDSGRMSTQRQSTSASSVASGCDSDSGSCLEYTLNPDSGSDADSVALSVTAEYELRKKKDQERAANSTTVPSLSLNMNQRITSRAAHERMQEALQTPTSLRSPQASTDRQRKSSIAMQDHHPLVPSLVLGAEHIKGGLQLPGGNATAKLLETQSEVPIECTESGGRRLSIAGGKNARRARVAQIDVGQGVEGDDVAGGVSATLSQQQQQKRVRLEQAKSLPDVLRLTALEDRVMKSHGGRMHLALGELGAARSSDAGDASDAESVATSDGTGRANSMAGSACGDTLGNPSSSFNPRVSAEGFAVGESSGLRKGVKPPYEASRLIRPLYSSAALHVSLVTLLLELLVDPFTGTLDEFYCDQFPSDNDKPNILFVLHCHLNHTANHHIIPILNSRVQGMGPSVIILWKILCGRLMNQRIYKLKRRLGAGAFGSVYRSRVHPPDAHPQRLVIKVMDVPDNPHSRCVTHDVFHEVLVLEKTRGAPQVTRLMDYGVSDNRYFLVMHEYQMSLSSWRSKVPENLVPFSIPLFLRIFQRVCEDVEFLHKHGVIHFDIKADNILLDLKHGDDELPFSLVLADYGESKVFIDDEDQYTQRNRGTESIKSPEMLSVAMKMQRDRANFDRRVKVGAGKASDVWSLGCLLFEIVGGIMLFYDDDWIRFFMRVTSESDPILSEKSAQYEWLLRNSPVVIDMLEYILTKDPRMRPTISDVLARMPTWIQRAEKSSRGPPVRIKKIVRRTADVVPPHDPSHVLFAEKLFSANSPVVRGWWNESEIVQIAERPSKILDSLFLSAASTLRQPRHLLELGISLIVDCRIRDGGNLQELDDHFDDFIFEDVGVIPYYTTLSGGNSLQATSCISDGVEEMEAACNFYRDMFQVLRAPATHPSVELKALTVMQHVISRNGKVLVMSTRGMTHGARLVMMYLMQTHGMTPLESYLFVQHKRPTLNTHLLDILTMTLPDQLLPVNNRPIEPSGERFQGGYDVEPNSNSKILCRCLCGQCWYAADEILKEKVGVFHSVASRNSPLPSIDKSYQRKMKQVYFWTEECPRWCLAVKNQVRGHLASEFVYQWKPEVESDTLVTTLPPKAPHQRSRTHAYENRTSSQLDPGESSHPGIQIRLKADREWQLYACRRCHYITHAITHLQQGEMPAVPTREVVALHTNIRAVHFCDGVTWDMRPHLLFTAPFPAHERFLQEGTLGDAVLSRRASLSQLVFN